MHYDAKKQQNQELVEKLKGLEQLEKENTELKAESDRLVRELQHTVLQVKESELRTKNLTVQVKSLEAQVGGTQTPLMDSKLLGTFGFCFFLLL